MVRVETQPKEGARLTKLEGMSMEELEQLIPEPLTWEFKEIHKFRVND